jgi:peptidoglycan LD-endopeptidase LytH
MRVALLLLCMASLGHADALARWGTFERDVRDGLITRDSARSALPSVYAGLLDYTKRSACNSAAPWRFPVEGGSVADMGKGGFRPEIRYVGSPICGYDFYDGNQHGGHPAYDIFIRDKDRDCRDDRTGMAVNVIAPVSMTILTVHDGWESGSAIRGGNYVWALAPDSGFLLYFAHLDTIRVEPGSCVHKGDTLGTIGRSGRNAADPKSPTHLHMMVLRVSGVELKPVDFVNQFR